MISLDELQLAARNHGMPLEALRHEITPLGLHYLLTHYDIPVVDAAAWRLAVDGLVERPLELSLDDLRAREAVTMPVTMECAGNGRAQLEPHVVSQPWIAEAIGTMEWTGVPVAALLAEAGVRGDEVVFTGLDRGVEGGVVQDYARSLSLADCDGALLAYAANGEPLPPQHGFPLRLVVPGWYGMTTSTAGSSGSTSLTIRRPGCAVALPPHIARVVADNRRARSRSRHRRPCPSPPPSRHP